MAVLCCHRVASRCRHLSIPLPAVLVKLPRLCCNTNTHTHRTDGQHRGRDLFASPVPYQPPANHPRAPVSDTQSHSINAHELWPPLILHVLIRGRAPPWIFGYCNPSRTARRHAMAQSSPTATLDDVLSVLPPRPLRGSAFPHLISHRRSFFVVSGALWDGGTDGDTEAREPVALLRRGLRPACIHTCLISNVHNSQPIHAGQRMLSAQAKHAEEQQACVVEPGAHWASHRRLAPRRGHERTAPSCAPAASAPASACHCSASRRSLVAARCKAQWSRASRRLSASAAAAAAAPARRHWRQASATSARRWSAILAASRASAGQTPFATRLHDKPESYAPLSAQPGDKGAYRAGGDDGHLAGCPGPRVR